VNKGQFEAEGGSAGVVGGLRGEVVEGVSKEAVEGLRGGAGSLRQC
jgi:hypothetical protein